MGKPGFGGPQGGPNGGKPFGAVEINPRLDKERTLQLLTLVESVEKDKACKLLGIPEEPFDYTCKKLAKDGKITLEEKDGVQVIAITDAGKEALENPQEDFPSRA